MKNKIIKFLIISILGISVLINPFISKANFNTEIERLSGKNREITSVKVSKWKYNKVDEVIITSGEDFPDAISSGSLAQILDIPILLSKKDNLSTDVKDEINRLKPSKIYIVGGESKISENSIKDLSIEYERIAGEDRYKTSEKVVEKYWELSDDKDNRDLIVAGGKNFPDALSSSYLSYKFKMPILLINGENSEYFQYAKYGVGSLKSLGLKKFDGELIFGRDRFETSLAILKYINEGNETVVLCSGLDFADALVSSTIGNPIILTGKTGLNRNVINYLSKIAPDKFIFVGGEYSLPKILEDQIIGGIDRNFDDISLPTPLESNESGKIMVLSYHDVGDYEDRYMRTPEGLKFDLLNLYKKGYLPISLKDYMNGVINIPRGYTPYIITFDDGNENKFRIFENGNIDKNSSYGILKYIESKLEEFNPKATFFINGEIPFRNKSQAKRKVELLLESGMDLGNHTLNHINLKNNLDLIEKEIALQKINLESYLPEEFKDYEVNLLAIPYSSIFTSSEYKRLISGQYNEIKYNNIALAQGGWKPDNMPNNNEYKLVNRIPATRIDVDGYGLYDYIEYFDKNPNERYIK